MIGLPAETTGLPPALRVPARQHLQHTLTLQLLQQACTKLPNGDGIYVHTAGFNNKLEPGGRCYGCALALVSMRNRINFRIRIQGFDTKNCKKNVQAAGEAFSRGKRKLKTCSFLTFIFLWIFCPPGSGSGSRHQNHCGGSGSTTLQRGKQKLEP
jgi:hypothetical protein